MKVIRQLTGLNPKYAEKAIITPIENGPEVQYNK